MGWWASSSSRESPEDARVSEARLQDTQNVIASIFEPGNRTLASGAPPTSTSVKSTTEKPSGLPSSTVSTPVATSVTLHSDTSNAAPPLYESTSRSGWRGLTRRLSGWMSPSSSSSSSGSPSATAESSNRNNEDDAAAFPYPLPAATKPTAAVPLSWDQLPPSPLAGYELTKSGLVDKLHTPPHTLSSAEVKDLLRELTAVEQKAKYDVDKQFAAHLGSRGLHGLELLVNPCLFLTGIYLMSWKAAQLYKSALPQDSVVFTRLLSFLQRRMQAGQREELAQRHRRLMRVTNARVALTFLTGVGLFSLAWVSRPVKNVMEEAPDMQTAREMVAYQRHTEATLKWCWFVYYHHPAYRNA